ncbi:DoxX family protein [Achromobacter pestifer]|uniref:DoxX family protein n=1 Tax=Achromobacter pestifer TaxID=1353889 RepID=A0A6S6YYL2_9BURK|nr:DoxX family protein [Achromobacter pestifer]CAB3648022.1 hypothetical protein LMG3431_02621 [Achromobacter pestifer]
MNRAAIASGAANTFGAPLLRVALGVMSVAHALLKLLAFTLTGTGESFHGIGLAGLLAYPAFIAELAGGAALVLGIYARQVVLLLVPIVAFAAWAPSHSGWSHESGGGGWEYPVFLIVASVSLWLLGDGAVTLKTSRRLTPQAT